MLDSKTFVVARRSPRWFLMGAHGVATDSCMVQHPKEKIVGFFYQSCPPGNDHISLNKKALVSRWFSQLPVWWDMDPFPAIGIIEVESPETLTFVRSTRYENCYTLHTPMLVSSPLPCISCRLHGNIMFHVQTWSISQTCFDMFLVLKHIFNYSLFL